MVQIILISLTEASNSTGMSNPLLVKFRLFVPQIWQQTVRHRGKLNLKFPRPRHEIPRFLEDLTKPIVVRQLPDSLEKCLEFKQRKAKEAKLSTNDAIEFERFLANYALGLFQKYEIMLICHRLPSSSETVRRNKVLFKKNETEVWTFNTITMRILMEENTKYANLYPVIESGFGQNYYLFFNQVSLNKNLSALKKMPHFVMLGGMIHDRLYTRNGILAYADLEPLDTQRGHLSNTFNQLLSSTVNNLSAPLRSLSQSLEQRAKSSKDEV